MLNAALPALYATRLRAAVAFTTSASLPYAVLLRRNTFFTFFTLYTAGFTPYHTTLFVLLIHSMRSRWTVLGPTYYYLPRPCPVTGLDALVVGDSCRPCHLPAGTAFYRLLPALLTANSSLPQFRCRLLDTTVRNWQQFTFVVIPGLRTTLPPGLLPLRLATIRFRDNCIVAHRATTVYTILVADCAVLGTCRLRTRLTRDPTPFTLPEHARAGLGLLVLLVLDWIHAGRILTLLIYIPNAVTDAIAIQFADTD